MNSIHEECGVFGVYSKSPYAVAKDIYYGLYALQHRGQESCGIVVCDDGMFFSHKDIGEVPTVFDRETLEKLPNGTMGIGHVRYSTTGGDDRNNCQPMQVNHQKGKMALAHNGNISNAYELRSELELGGAIFHSTSDTEIIAYLLTKERLTHPSIEEAVLAAMPHLEGAYSLVLMSATKLIAVRDPHGFRPLCYGIRSDGQYIVASESCALEAVGAEFIRDLYPGEVLVFGQSDAKRKPGVSADDSFITEEADGIISYSNYVKKKEKKTCIFEYIYFARPDSVIDGVSVHEARMRAGSILARNDDTSIADVVVGVPDSGLDAALGYSRESGIPYGIGLIKNKYIGRTFISPTQEERVNQVRIKLNPVRSTVEGKRIILIDDSIVRGTTSGHIVKLLRDAGANEIHMRISAPPFMHPCYYGTDIDSEENLIACHHSVTEIAEMIGADSLKFLPVELLSELILSNDYCNACFSGDYPTDIPQNTSKNRFEQPLSKRNNNS
ncbi:MAG: amidophosphoribosyltransferase [Eubacterium sp.]|nr:amidophosphoribosyltransferase [Eubacterium sp.]